MCESPRVCKRARGYASETKGNMRPLYSKGNTHAARCQDYHLRTHLHWSWYDCQQAYQAYHFERKWNR
nr:MAG TPA: hypothetical protein [Caudoviricetes sp.]